MFGHSPQGVRENLMSPKARQNNPPSFWGKEDFMVYLSDEMYDSLKKVVKYILQNVSFTCTKLRRCEGCPPFHNSVIPTHPDCKSSNSHHWLGDLKTTFFVFWCIKMKVCFDWCEPEEKITMSLWSKKD